MKKSLCFLTALLVVIVDQITKYLARSFIEMYEAVKVLPFLHLVSVRNEGAAFGMFKGFGNTAFILVSLAAMAFVTFLLMREKDDRLALSLILGGAAGNMIDRVIYGNVTDFIDVFAGRFHWPAFNVADSALTVGLVIMLFRSLFHLRREEKA